MFSPLQACFISSFALHHTYKVGAGDAWRDWFCSGAADWLVLGSVLVTDFK
jgi:hypothetical protein